MDTCQCPVLEWEKGSVQSGVCGVELLNVEMTRVTLVDYLEAQDLDTNRELVLFLRTSGSLVLKSGDYPFSGGKELTPLPPSEKSSSPSPLATLGPLWGANGEGGDAVEKDLPVTEGSQRVGLPSIGTKGWW